MNWMTQLYAPIVGRILMGGYFLWSSVGVILNTPNLTSLIGAAVLIEALGGIALIVGYKTRLAALILAVFTLVVSFTAVQYELNSIAVIGGLLYISAYGYDVWPPNKNWYKKTSRQ